MLGMLVRARWKSASRGGGTAFQPSNHGALAVSLWRASLGWLRQGVHTSVNAARTSACATICQMKAIGLVLVGASCLFAQGTQKTFNVVEATIPEMRAAMEHGKVTSHELV